MSDWPTYKLALEREGLDPAEYLDMEAKLASKVFWDVDTCRAIRSREELAYFANGEIIPAIKSVIARRHEVDRSGRCFNSLVCSWCSFNELCVEEAKGGDVEFMKQTLYRIKGTRMTVPVLEEDV